MMLNKIQIRNFRHNKRLDVKLSRITTLRGPSGSGKSSFIGALKWITFNVPSGTNFINWDSYFALVRLMLDKKYKIIRKRSKTQNYYKIDKKHKYHAFRTGVPTTVASLLNMTSLNFQRQHAGPFWFRETAGEVSRQLNAIVNLDLIDTTLANLDKEQRETKYQVKNVQQRIKEAKQKKSKLQYVLTLDKKLSKLEVVKQQHKEDTEKIWVLTGLTEQAKQYQLIMNKQIPNIKPLIALQNKYDNISDRLETLTNLVELVSNYKYVIKEMNKRTKEDKTKLKKLMGKRCPLCSSVIKE